MNSTNSNVELLKCEKKPHVNVLRQDVFLDRAKVIFETLGDILGKSLGAYGAPTIISNFPYSHVTKDGFTIAKNLTFDKDAGEEVDRIIAGLAIDICGRLNYAVGDGTTSAIVAVNQLYKQIHNSDITEGFVRPSDLLDVFEHAREVVVAELEKAATPITKDNMEESIRKIVNISSNGDKKITDLITSAYHDAEFPSIICELSQNEDTYTEVTDGFTFRAMLADKLYINNDNDTAQHNNVDVIMFDHKLNQESYTKIVRPLSIACRHLGRHLVCLAPWYDEEMMGSLVKRDLLGEYQQTRDITLILLSYARNTSFEKKAVTDLAMLLNTSIIDKGLESDILNALIDEPNLEKIVNLNERGIEGITVPDNENMKLVRCDGSFNKDIADNTLLRLGFATSFTGGLKQSFFKCEHYNADIYEHHMSEAKRDLQETIDKYAMLGTYTKDVYEAQKRCAGLNMKLTTIYVGGQSLLSRDLLKDSVDDAVRAAESAYRFGYVQGCNLTLIQTLSKLAEECRKDETSLDYKVINTLLSGFKEVYKQVLRNAFGTSAVSCVDDLKKFNIALTEEEKGYVDDIIKAFVGNSMPVYELLVEISMKTDKVFDLDVMAFTNDVINSVKTDIEILSATIDLLSLLITGNQVVIQKYAN